MFDRVALAREKRKDEQLLYKHSDAEYRKALTELTVALDCESEEDLEYAPHKRQKTGE